MSITLSDMSFVAKDQTTKRSLVHCPTSNTDKTAIGSPVTAAPELATVAMYDVPIFDHIFHLQLSNSLRVKGRRDETEVVNSIDK